MRITNAIVIILIVTSFVTSSCILSVQTEASTQKYIALKVDDAGIKYQDYYDETWRSFYQYYLENDKKVDLAIIGGRLTLNDEIVTIRKLLKNNNNFELYCHGWYHYVGSENIFAPGHTIQEQIDVLNNWTEHIQNLFNYETVILGTPGNNFDSTQIYKAMSATGYEVLYFNDRSSYPAYSSTYIKADHGIPGTPVVTYEECLQMMLQEDKKSEEILIIQLHPYCWDQGELYPFLDKIYADLDDDTNREWINIEDYYFDVYLEQNPDYPLHFGDQEAETDTEPSSVYLPQPSPTFKIFYFFLGILILSVFVLALKLKKEKK